MGLQVSMQGRRGLLKAQLAQIQTPGVGGRLLGRGLKRRALLSWEEQAERADVEHSLWERRMATDKDWQSLVSRSSPGGKGKICVASCSFWTLRAMEGQIYKTLQPRRCCRMGEAVEEQLENGG